MMCILYKSYIWTADKEQKWKWSSQLWSNLSSYKQSPEKKSEASTGFKPMTSVPTGAFTSNEYHRCLCFFIIYKARLFLQNKILSFLLTTVSACPKWVNVSKTWVYGTVIGNDREINVGFMTAIKHNGEEPTTEKINCEQSEQGALAHQTGRHRAGVHEAICYWSSPWLSLTDVALLIRWDL